MTRGSGSEPVERRGLSPAPDEHDVYSTAASLAFLQPQRDVRYRSTRARPDSHLPSQKQGQAQAAFVQCSGSWAAVSQAPVKIGDTADGQAEFWQVGIPADSPNSFLRLRVEEQ